MNLPRFKIGEINPRLGHENAGDAFQVFAYEVLLREFPRLHLFRPSGALFQNALNNTLQTRMVRLADSLNTIRGIEKHQQLKSLFFAQALKSRTKQAQIN